MNAAMVRALFLDALYQVLDNRVFRILVLGVVVLVGLTFAVGFRESEVVLFFGWRRYDYDELFMAFGAPAAPGIDLRLQAIRLVQQVFVDYVAGSLGMAFAIAATAFFVPRMLERGLADGLFSKPIARWVFYLTRFVAGLLFIALLALLLVGGIHLGFAVSSNYSDPGFLWAGVTLVYVFALLHGVSMLIGVWTRSTVAAILLSLVFFLLNGCVHNAWILKEWGPDRAGEGGSSRPPGSEQSAEIEWFTNFVLGTIDVLHFALPKTTDASILTAKLRAVVERSEPLLRDGATAFALQDVPEGFERASEPSFAEPLYLPRAGRGDAVVLAAGTWHGDADAARFWIERSLVPDGPALSLKARAEALEAALRGEEPTLDIRTRHAQVQDESARAIEIVDPRSTPKRHTLVLIFPSPARESRAAFAVVVDAREGWRPGDTDDASPETASSPAAAPRSDIWAASRVVYDLRERVEDQLILDTRDRGEGPPFHRWYADQLRWNAPLRYNALLSVGSSLAFVLVVLGLGAWMLRRNDF